MEGNLFESLPEWIYSLPNIRILAAGSNRLSHLVIPHQVPLLEGLYVDSNELSTLPNLELLPKLNILSASHNRITAVEESIAKVLTLTNIYLDHNLISSFPLHKMTDMPSLNILFLHENCLQSYQQQAQEISLWKFIFGSQREAPQEELPLY